MAPSSASQSQSTGCGLVSDCQQTSGGKKMATTNDQKRMIRRHQVANGERSWIRNPSGFSGRSQQNRKCRYLRGRPPKAVKKRPGAPPRHLPLDYGCLRPPSIVCSTCHDGPRGLGRRDALPGRTGRGTHRKNPCARASCLSRVNSESWPRKSRVMDRSGVNESIFLIGLGFVTCMVDILTTCLGVLGRRPGVEGGAE